MKETVWATYRSSSNSGLFSRPMSFMLCSMSFDSGSTNHFSFYHKTYLDCIWPPHVCDWLNTMNILLYQKISPWPSAHGHDKSAHGLSAHGQLLVPKIKTKLYGNRSFAGSGPIDWNRLPSTLYDCSISLSTFKKRLKTHLFLSYGQQKCVRFGVCLHFRLQYMKCSVIIISILLMWTRQN